MIRLCLIQEKEYLQLCHCKKTNPNILWVVIPDFRRK